MVKERLPEARERLRNEMHMFLLISAYLYACLGALLLYKAALLSPSGVHTLSLGFAAGKAMILAKFVLIGEAARIGARVESRSLLRLIVRRSVLFMALLIALTIVEELLIGRVHGHSMAQTLAGFREKSLPEVLAMCLLLLLILVPIVASIEMDRVLGRGALRRVLLGSPAPGRTTDTEQ
jgi:hypothetical protein